jgi:hypothetical protein
VDLDEVLPLAGEPAGPARAPVRLTAVDPGRRHIRDTTPAP